MAQEVSEKAGSPSKASPNGYQETFNTSRLFLRTLKEAGIRVIFVNLGSDHPALVHAFAEMNSKDEGFRIITAPNEMVALSAAQGYAQVMREPAAVIVHVDAGTLALGQAIHNIDRSRTPCLIYAGMSPFSFGKEIRGSRNEFIFWWQDVHDQPAIVRQYMRYTGQIHDGRTVQHNVMRALQFARSEPQGPVYLHARREAMEQELDPREFAESVDTEDWAPLGLGCLPPAAVKRIAEALLSAKSPLCITSYLGRNVAAVPLLAELAEKLVLPVQVNNGANVNIPSSHPCYVGAVGGMEPNELIRTADVILVIDCELPWIPMHNTPAKDCQVFHLDIDPLKAGMQSYHIAAKLRLRVDSEVALQQLLDYIGDRKPNEGEARLASLAERNSKRLKNEQALEARLTQHGDITVPYLLKHLREALPERTTIVNEAITSFAFVWNHIKPERSGSMYTSGGAALGWSLGAAVGVGLANQIRQAASELVCVVVGDGSFMFCIPSVSYWMARQYETPHLTVILNNGGYKAPKFAALRQYPESLVATGPSDALNVTFPNAPQYEVIAQASGNAWGCAVKEPAELAGALKEAVRVVQEERRCACLNVFIEKL